MSELALKVIAENKQTRNTTLDLGNCGLTEIPQEAMDCLWVETLILSSAWLEYDFEKKKGELNQSRNKGENNQITSLLPTLFQLSKLRILVFNGNPIDDLTPLADMTHLQQLDCASTQISDLSPLSGLFQLKILECYSTQISDLSPLSGLIQLQVLSCSYTSVSDLSPLSGLLQLHMLYCSGMPLSDLLPISGLLDLQELYCSEMPLSDLSPLSNLVKLQRLECLSTQVSDLSPLSRLIQLQELNFSNTQISDLSPLSGLIKIQGLNCSSTKVSDISPLSGLIELQELYCTSTSIDNLSPLKELLQLQLLNCSYTQVSDLTPLLGLRQLQKIYCYSTRVNDLEPIANLSELQIIHCADTPVSDLSPLSGLLQLQKIYCPSTGVSNLEPISRLLQLQVLDCSYTKVNDLSPLSGLLQLQKIYCPSTGVSNLEPISRLLQLQVLDCSYTKVNDLSPLIGLIQLQILNCISTRVTKIKPLTKINSLQKYNLKGCRIEDCPADIYETENIDTLRAYFEEKNRVILVKINKNIIIDTRKDVKLILLGNSNSGKTSLIHYLETGNFLEDRNSTHGLEVRRWLPDPQRFPELIDIAVSIWDFGGQEYYHEAYRLFLSNNAAYLLIWDGTSNFNGRKPTELKSGEPKEDLEHFELNYWLDTIRHFSFHKDTSPLLLIQNKTDLPGGKIRIEHALYDKYGIKETVHISLKTGCELSNAREVTSLRQMEMELTEILISRADKASLPDDWLKIRQAILNIQGSSEINNNPFYDGYDHYDGSISIKAFEKAAEKVIGRSLPSNVSGTNLLEVFERGGIVTFFPESKDLKDKAFLNPKILVERLYDILKKEVLALGGDFAPEQVFKGKDATYQDVFLAVACDLELIFPHPVSGKEGRYIAPQYLPDIHPIEDVFEISSHNVWQTGFWLRVPLFYYKKLLHGLVLHYASKNGEALARHFWKNGIVFKKNNMLVMIKGLYPAKEERDGLLLVAVQKVANDEHVLLQREIFQKCLYFLGITLGKNVQSRKLTQRLEYLEKSGHASLNTDQYNLIPNWVEVSKDGQFFLPYPDLLEAHVNDDVRVAAKDKQGNKQRLLIRDVEALLPKRTHLAKKVFISYSHRDTMWLARLQAHLSLLRRSNKIESWTDVEIRAGEEWDKSIKDALFAADIFILILSADFIASNYIWEVELKAAFEAYNEKKKKIIPIMMEPIDLGGLPDINIRSISNTNYTLNIRGFEVIPKNEQNYLKAVSLWQNPEEALAVIAKRIREAIEAR